MPPSNGPEPAELVHIDVEAGLPATRIYRVTSPGRTRETYRGENLDLEAVFEFEVTNYREAEAPRIKRGEFVDDILASWPDKVISRVDGRVEGLILFEPGVGIRTLRIVRPGHGIASGID